VPFDLGTLGSDYSIAYGINDVGKVVGDSFTSSGQPHAFLWNNGKMFDLNNLLSDNSGWELVSAQGINNRGQIVGYGFFYDQGYKAFLLTPVRVSN